MSALGNTRPLPLVQRVRPRDLRLVNDGCTLVLLAWYLLPAFKIVARSPVFAAALGLWGVTAFCIRRDWLSLKGSHMLALAAWYVVFVLNMVFGRSSMFGQYLFIMTVFFTPAVLYHFYQRTGQFDRLRQFLWLALAMVCVTAVTTLIGQFNYPIPSRTLSKGIESYTELYSSQNIGGFGFTYGLMLYVIALTAFARSCGRGSAQEALFSLVPFFVVVIVTTLISQFNYPIPSRTLSKGIQSFTDLYSSLNIGGFGFTYGLMLYTIALTVFARRRGRGSAQEVLFSLVLFFVVVIVMTEFTIAMGLVALGVLLALALRPRRAVVITLWAVAAALALVLAFDAFAPLALRFAAGIGSVTIRDRVQDVLRFLSTGQLSGDFSLRVEKYTVSVRTALAQPLWGVGAWYGYDTELRGVGGHVELFDTLARYGLAGFVPLAWFFVATLRDTARQFRGTAMAVGMPAFFVLFTLYAATNTFFTSAEIGLVLFFLVPAMAYWDNAKRAPTPQEMR